MARVSFTPDLGQQYEQLFNSCAVPPERAATVDQLADRVLVGEARYQSVGSALGIPWFFIGAVHNMESDCRFDRHLHNGDPLTARTVQVPAGRPPTGSPPFAWEESALDALTLRELSGTLDWSLSGTLFQLEGYNGWGYRLYHTHVLSPYLWGFSNHYTSGKYVADGTWSDTAVSQQCGGAVILRRLAERGQIQFPDQPAPAGNAPPLVAPFSDAAPTDPAALAQATALQQWLNTFPGVFVKVDGAPGEKTSDAYRQVTGSYLPGDPRA